MININITKEEFDEAIKNRDFKVKYHYLYVIILEIAC
jgi:hypothetical protein